MRLLKVQAKAEGGFTLTNHDSKDLPAYAILSHTWGEDDSEYTFEDLQKGTGTEKLGYKKLIFCGTQAKKDGLQFFGWTPAVSTKVAARNLQNQSTQCSNVHQLLRHSRWFTRGWTLQELLAPADVGFFSVEGTFIGDKDSLGHQISQATNIPAEALQARDLAPFSTEERMGWSKGRNTKREEDMAYALLGIFGIHMPLIYGEGKEHALKRLHEEIGKNSHVKVYGTGSRNRNHGKDLQKLSKWLSAPDPSMNQHKAAKLRHKDTGLWFIEGHHFRKWKIEPASLLWLYGIPGCGKTILSCAIIESLLQHCEGNNGSVTAYFYFDFNDTQKQSPVFMLESLLCQLSERLGWISEKLDRLCSSSGNGTRQPTLHALLAVTQDMICKFANVFIVLDAMDECTQRHELMDLLEAMISWQLPGLHLLMTSRKDRDITSFLESYVKFGNMICLQSDVVDKDIQQYVRKRLCSDKALLKWSQDTAIRQEVESALMNGAHGMFRWAACQLDALAKCHNRVMLRKALATLPQTLDQTYDRILCAISADDFEYAIRILRWVAFSARPLSVKEVADAIAIDVFRDPVFEWDEVFEDPLEVLGLCPGFFAIAMERPRREVVVLAHYSIKEYLLSERILAGPAARFGMRAGACHKIIAESCLGYAIEDCSNAEDSRTKQMKKFALTEYAANFWAYHAHIEERKLGTVSKKVLKLLSVDRSASYLRWCGLLNRDTSPDVGGFGGGYNSYVDCPAPLYFTSFCGLVGATKLILKRKDDVNASGQKYGYALHAAAENGHEQIVQLLLEAGADVNARGGEYDTALQAATFADAEQVIQLLLNAGADVNATGPGYGTALGAAAWAGRTQVIEMLLNAGANINIEVPGYGSPLLMASLQGQGTAVRLLLDMGSDVNAQNGYYGSALQAASAKSHEHVVKMLLDAGADVNAQSGHYGSSYYLVSQTGKESESFINFSTLGERVKARAYREFVADRDKELESTPLYAASAEGHERVVAILLEAGANVNVACGHFGDALQAAIFRCHVQVVKMLLDAGAEINIHDGQYTMPFTGPFNKWTVQIMELLVGTASRKSREILLGIWEGERRKKGVPAS